MLAKKFTQETTPIGNCSPDRLKNTLSILRKGGFDYFGEWY
jgi:hypothetical protein